MTIIDYKLLQADGNNALAAEVMRFVKDGWEPHGTPLVLQYEVLCNGKTVTGSFAQAMVKREPESEELTRLRWLLAEATEAIKAAEQGMVDEKSALAHIAATVVQCERKTCLKGG